MTIAFNVHEFLKNRISKSASLLDCVLLSYYLKTCNLYYYYYYYLLTPMSELIVLHTYIITVQYILYCKYNSIITLTVVLCTLYFILYTELLLRVTVHVHVLLK